MKWMLSSLFLFVVCFVSIPPAHATDFVFSSFQCDPISCQETGPTATISEAFLSVNSTCTGGAVEGYNKSITVTVGTPGECQAPYTPFVLAEKLSSTLLDDCGDPYQVDTLRLSGEVFDALGVVVYSSQSEFSCDGGVSSPTVFGTKPC